MLGSQCTASSCCSNSAVSSTSPTRWCVSNTASKPPDSAAMPMDDRGCGAELDDDEVPPPAARPKSSSSHRCACRASPARAAASANPTNDPELGSKPIARAREHQVGARSISQVAGLEATPLPGKQAMPSCTELHLPRRLPHPKHRRSEIALSPPSATPTRHLEGQSLPRVGAARVPSSRRHTPTPWTILRGMRGPSPTAMNS
mmetsp:Transcript_99761/g.320147  ORF Transcript_99761/g.320147 Transcript_99761/m.320147 type:complete len:203 (+) Transcript_99761:310-918(+)